MKGALDGIRVIDWTMYNVGPYCSAMLADLGAEVIHVEEREVGDRLRGTERWLDLPVSFPHGGNVFFEEADRNKKSLAIDLKKPGAREVIYRLVERSDVFVHNIRPRIVKKFGMDYETLCRYNPRLIYASLSGFGNKGPDSDLGSIDIIGCARSGAMWACAPRGGEPVILTTGIGDRAASMFGAYGVLAALLAREKYGIGQEVQTSQLVSMMVIQGWSFMPLLFFGYEYPRYDRASNGNPLYNTYKCKDGKWLVLGAVRQTDWGVLCRAIGHPELENDQRYNEIKTRPHEETDELRRELISLLDKVFATKTLKEWSIILKEADISFSPVNAFSDLLQDEQVAANNYITTWNHPTLGEVKFLGFPVEMSQTPLTLRSPAPQLGQHTEEILTEICGYSWNEIARLREEEIL